MLIVWALNRFLLHMKPGTYSIVQAFVLGITYMFHLFLVGYDIRRKHPDLRAGGYLFTLVVVLVVNAQVLAAVSMLAFDGANWFDFNRDVFANMKHQYRWFWGLVRAPFKEEARGWCGHRYQARADPRPPGGRFSRVPVPARAPSRFSLPPALGRARCGRAATRRPGPCKPRMPRSTPRPSSATPSAA